MSKGTLVLDEKALETELCKQIASGESARKAIRINTQDKTCSLFDLLAGFEPQVIQDNSDWNNHKHLSQDLFGGMTPDIVLRSKTSGENRIVIEVKKTSDFTHTELDASQVLRYFLHLLATTNKRQGADISRAVLLAAPKQWFESNSAKPWNHFLKQYQPLATQFEIVLGNIILSA
jgi:hypothetical protein